MIANLMLQLCLVCSTAVESSVQPTGRVVEYDLVIEEKIMSPAGKAVRALTVNGGIPGPVLRFTEGDTARIRVHNRLKNETTSTHWHGLLLPPIQDGVPEVTTPLIHPGTTRTFEFLIRQSGTYWYHSHTHLQEQLGVYGSIVITPQKGEVHRADRDYVLQLSDWTNEDPHEVQRNLLRGSEGYAVRKGNRQSLVGAARAGALKEYLGNEWDRMMPMDVSDVAYDAFLINGKPRSELVARAGETVRLRLINSGASTYFYAESATGMMTIVAADGMPVQPVKVKRLFIGMAETYDVLIKVPSSGHWEFRTTAQDGSGHASVMIGEGGGKTHLAPEVPKPELYRMEHMMDAALNDDHDSLHDAERPGAPYELLKSPGSTKLPKQLPVRTVPLRLTGDMERYQWGFNGKTMAEEALIPVKKGEVLRFELVNDTMMHHPLHLHGHFFRVVNRHGDHSPLKHTVDLPPMGKATIEFEANEVGDWVFHCHLLYHMMAGMTRIVTYQDPLPEDQVPSLHSSGAHGAVKGHHDHGGGAKEWNGSRWVNLGEHGHEMWSFWGEASAQSHMSEGSLNLRRRHDDFYINWEAGWQEVEDFEYEVDVLYERYLGPNVRAFGGVRLTNEDEAENRGVAGLRYRLPMFVWSSVLVDTEGDVELSLSKEFAVTNRLSVFGEVAYDTNTEWEWSAGASYWINQPVSLVVQYHSEFGIGGGVVVRF
ncbi:hypothetical protein FEM03_11555 [Phragmitibacter flavus]|uniref:Copper oxidase n=1 Tax=Phragmitibacter flavus TaxID=2576071 RepID=A0A5R8KDI6_9BACT|nr:multicopper oxidase domain-containing protein [Phragmitibacter flavus]TLD70364.1 hypothetical protein FEM03_11555 [Phragmitibacter flavus]